MPTGHPAVFADNLANRELCYTIGTMKNVIIAILALIVIGGGIYFVIKNTSPAPTETTNQTPTTTGMEPVSTTTAPAAATSTVQGFGETKSVIGTSAGGNDIVAYHFGNGAKDVLIVGGIHGGYDWNTSLFSYDLIDYFKSNPTAVPSSLSVTVIPTMNPDGQDKIIGTPGQFADTAAPAATVDTVAGRLNANNVDLNRNFDCNWKPTGVWNSHTVSGGTAAFSEPEAAAVRDYINTTKPAAVIVYYAAAGAVYSSSCNGGVLPLTTALNKVYATASGYTSYPTFNAYPLTGDMTDWLAKIGIPAISVLFTNHSDPEWTKNQAGTLAVLKYLAAH